MIDGKRLVAIVPAGERRYSQILARYLEHEKDAFDELDEVRWCLNTGDQADRDWICSLPKRRPDLHSVSIGETPKTRSELIRGIAALMDREGRDPDTVYVRLDHDIVYITPGLVGSVARAALKSAIDDKLMVFPHVINWPVGKRASVGPEEAEVLHREFLADPVDYPPIPPRDVTEGILSANCMGWLGSRLPSLERSLERDWKFHEEYVLTTLWMNETGRPHVIDPNCGTAVHFTFFGQKEYLDGTDLLELYRRLCVRMTGLEPE